MTALNRQPAKTVALFRIAQEGLCNIERHAHASLVDIQLCRHGNRVELTLIDNGRGCPADALYASTGIGLRNIRERVEHLAGDFLCNPSQGAPCCVSACPWNARLCYE